MSSVGCGVIRDMLNITSLKSSKRCMNANGDDGERAQILKYHGARDVFQLNQFRFTRHDKVNNLFNRSMDAITEENKFEVFSVLISGLRT